MIARPKDRQTVAELMQQRAMDIGDLVQWSGLEQRVIQALVDQRYTPSPQQRERVSQVLGVAREQIIWGHRNFVDGHIHSPD